MFAREIKLNRFQIDYFGKVMKDIPDDKINDRAGGAGHPPLWILGHLAICAELGQAMLGGEMKHPAWLPLFGPASSDDVSNSDNYTKEEFTSHIVAEYPRLCEMLTAAPEERMNAPHGVELLEGTLIETVGDLQAHLLTTHFSFHLAQLSGWRRAMGGAPLI